METSFLIDQLKENHKVFLSLFTACKNDPRLITWKPDPDRWSLIEVVCHLVDEEVLDFRTRVRFALEKSEGQPPSIDPQNWVITKNYIGQDFQQKCDQLTLEREQSINWLKSLTDVDWNGFYIHPKFGKFTAHFLLVNWLAHDLLHIKQITKLRYDYLAFISGEKLAYAGEWK